MADVGSQDATRVPASRFPEPTDLYFCDSCGRDVTQHLYRGKAHMWRPLGPIWYTCKCGAKYLSGAVEWDDLSQWERKQRAWQLGIAPVILIALAIPAAIAYYGVHARSLIVLAIFAVLAIPAPVFAWLLGLTIVEALEIVKSMWRTRVSYKFLSRKPRGH